MPRFDEFNLPIENGASDAADSARLAGLMSMIGHPQAPDLNLYRIHNSYVRHPYAKTYPENHPRVMSRDQLVGLAAGYKAQGLKWEFYDEWWAPNDLDEVALREGKEKKKIPDFLMPSVRNHFRLCAGLEPKHSDKWLSLNLKYNAWRIERWMQGKEPYPVEQNQLICLCYSANRLKEYRETPNWENALRHYWEG
jgi:hypothetical protein